MATPDKKTIMVIDDDLTLRLIAEKKLTQQGYQVVSAGSGKEGLQLFIKQMPDLLLLDYELPDMTGVNLCHQLRNELSLSNIPILFIAGKDDYISIENAFQVGATDFSSKPLNWTILMYRIQYMLRAHEINRSLLSSENRLSNAQKIAKIANWEYKMLDKSFQWSDTIYDILEISREQMKSNCIDDFFARVVDEDIKKLKTTMFNCFENHTGFELEHKVIASNGKIKIISHLASVIKNDNGEAIDCIGTLQDITERRTAEEKIRTLAFYDSLTGLMNRESFLAGLDHILESNTNYNLISALLFIDLDDFKRVNDTLGHDFGDLLLCDVAERLQLCVRTAEKDKEYTPKHLRLLKNELPDRVTKLSSIDISRFDLGRLGGDEFLVFLTDIPSEKIAANISSRILKALEKPFYLDGHEVYISFSIGIAISPDNGSNIQTLLKNADTAMYSAKAHGKNNFQFYNQTMNERALYRLTLESDLRKAISKNELYLVYQPQFDLQTQAFMGAEVLMRWKHPVKGSISPAEFIPLAEETGQILIIGDWLFEQFSQELTNWKQQGLIPTTFKLALNISSLQFHQSNMIDKVKHYFPDRELNRHVEFELTETVMMKNASSNLQKLDQVVEHNITLSIDDFGTGYSSLSYLHSFPVETVKIDRSFITNLENDNQVNIVKAIIAMAHGMNIKVVAEGIENQWQSDFLTAEGCDIGQGFFLAKPLDKDEFHQFLISEREAIKKLNTI